MVKIKEFENVYPPSEDSMLLLKAVGYAKGDVLDMFAGSGIIGLTAAANARNVTLVDVNPHAVEAIKYNAIENRISNFKCLQSDLFSALGKKRFDVIYANPPYLPGKAGKNWMDRALNGGADGNELTIKFISGIRKHLKHDGKAFIILSSIYDTNKVYKEIKRLRFSFKKLSSINFFFEELFLIELYDKGGHSSKRGKTDSGGDNKRLRPGAQSKKSKRGQGHTKHS